LLFHSLIQSVFTGLLSNWAGAWSPKYAGGASLGQLSGTRRLHSQSQRMAPGSSGHTDTYDGQNSGADFNPGGGFNPPTGWVNNTDGGRGVLFPDYHQQ